MNGLCKRAAILVGYALTLMCFWNYFVVPSLGVGHKSASSYVFLVLGIICMNVLDLFNSEWEKRVQWISIISGFIAVAFVMGVAKLAGIV